MMGDRDYRSIIKNTIDSIGKELEIQIDAKNFTTIHLEEVTKCLRRSFFDRMDPIKIERRGFNELLSGLLQKLKYGSDPKVFSLGEDISLIGHADMLVDDSIILFRPASEELEDPIANDILYLNACMWIYDKFDGMIIYITSDKKETTFALTRSKKMFEEIIRRIKVFNNLLKEQKAPILEPSLECSDCQYYERCFMKRKNTKQLSLAKMLGISDSD